MELWRLISTAIIIFWLVAAILDEYSNVHIDKISKSSTRLFIAFLAAALFFILNLSKL